MGASVVVCAPTVLAAAMAAHVEVNVRRDSPIFGSTVRFMADSLSSERPD